MKMNSLPLIMTRLLFRHRLPYLTYAAIPSPARIPNSGTGDAVDAAVGVGVSVGTAVVGVSEGVSGVITGVGSTTISVAPRENVMANAE